MSMDAIDLFSGCGGLTTGLKSVGITVAAAIEFDVLAANTYRLNHPEVELIQQDIRGVDPREVRLEMKKAVGELELLAGCPPCQGFSSITTRNGSNKEQDPRNLLVYEFVRFLDEFMPKTFMFENVSKLAGRSEFERLMREFRQRGYFCSYGVMDAASYGVPQRRKRLIVLGGRGFLPALPRPAKTKHTVRTAIESLPWPETSADPLHRYHRKHSQKVLEIIASVPKDGGNRSSLPESLQLDCHRKTDGFRDVYGRMAWDKPSPTITGGCINPSKGRFIHPEQDRAITLREAALLQGFPANYNYDMSGGLYNVAQMIGNAFPPPFAMTQAKTLAKSMN